MGKSEEQIRDELNKELKGRLSASPFKKAVRVLPKLGNENPFAEAAALAEGEKGAANLYGACSIEKFCSAGSLSLTHEDAQGWLNYVEQFNPRNFWFMDEWVKPWIYYEQYDNWQDTYGIDAVRAFYHSGHGGMDGNGKFYLPMGSDWGGLGCTVTTDPTKMGLGGGHPDESSGTFGNEKVRYIFWSTCLSCRVLDGQTPIRTWFPVHRGFRMLFGFETTSWDSADYGKNFWDEWNRNSKPLSTAWLDASWRIAQNMAPSAVACGATSDEAVNRLYNERYLYAEPASNAWWAWRWYNVASVAREPNLTLPQASLVAKLQPAALSEQYISSVMNRLSIEPEIPKNINLSRNTVFAGEDDLQIGFGKDGSYEVKIANPNLTNKEQISQNKAKSKAQEAVNRFGLGSGISLALDLTRFESEAFASKDMKSMEGPFTTQTTVQFKQIINGLPVITPGVGEVRVSVDNDGSVSRLQSSVRQVSVLTDQPGKTTIEPSEDGIGRKPRKEIGYEQTLIKGWQERLTSMIVRGTVPVQYSIVPGSTEVGYDIRGDEAILAARRAMEVDFGNGYLKRYWVIVPLE